MRRRARSGGWGALGLAALGLACLTLGCGGAPVPLVARAGTTIGLAVTDESSGGSAIGFGFGLGGVPDHQRGYLAFELKDAVGGDVDCGQGSARCFLPVRMITRAAPDPASPIARSGFAVLPSLFTQIMVLLDVPTGVPPADGYQIFVARYAGLLDAFNGIPPIDAGPPDSPHWILDVVGPGALEDFTPFDASVNGQDVGALAYADLALAVPSPKLILRLPDTPQIPAAATIDVGFDPTRVDVLDAIVNQMVTQAAFVTYEFPDADTVRIHYVHPAADRRDLAVVFTLNAATSYDPVDVADFAIEDATLYDTDGNVIGGAAALALVEIR